jgi:hypothetical protein
VIEDLSNYFTPSFTRSEYSKGAGSMLAFEGLLVRAIVRDTARNVKYIMKPSELNPT